jgi:hypothetical protein
MTVEIGIVAAAILVVLAALVFALARRHGEDRPAIEAKATTLREGLHQIDIKVTNRGPHALAAESLRRVRPLAARLLAPVTQVATREGNFQVWSDPEGDQPTTKIAVDLMLGPWQPAEGVVTSSAEGHIAAWLFLRKEKDLSRLLLELVLREEGGRLRRLRFGVTPASA